MSSKRKKAKSVTIANQFLNGFRLRGLVANPTLWILLATAGLVVLAQVNWGGGTPTTSAPDPEFLIGEKTIVVNEPADWIGFSPQSMIQTEFLTRPRSLLEPTLVGELAKYLQSWPFVESVESIVKKNRTIDVKLTFRQPLACVEWKTPQSVHKRLIDKAGQVLPTSLQLDPARESQILIINAPQLDPSKLNDWQVWPDSRIVDAALIAQVLQDEGPALGFRRIVTFRLPRHSQSPYELWTRAGGKVLWSDHPSQDSRELNEKRLALIRNWITANGTLDQLNGWKRIDVRSGALKLIDEEQDVARNTPTWIDLK